MYATPYTPNKILQLHIVPERVSNAWRGPEQLRLPPASLQRIFEAFRWNRDGFARVGLTYSRDDLRREVKRIKILGSSRPVEELANNIIEAGNFQEEATKLLFFVIQPRIHPLQLIAYAEVNAYLFQDGRVLKRVAFRTDERSVREVFVSMTKAPITHPR